MWTALAAIQARMTYTHEHGHNLGMNHDSAGQYETDLSVTAIRKDALGYVDTINRFRTVMAQNDTCRPFTCTRVPCFSNPDVLYQGHVTGVKDKRDNAAVAEELAAPMVAGYRTRVTPGPTPDAFEDDNEPGEWKAYAGAPQSRNFAGDTVDWIGSYNSGNNRRVYETSGLETQADTCIYIYHVIDDDPANLPGNYITQDCDSGFGQGSRLVLDQPPGNYLIKVVNSNGVTGENTGYTFSVTNQQALTATPDTYESDDPYENWKAYTGVPQGHNFADDKIDWVASYNGAARYRVYRTKNLGPYADTCITVYTVGADLAPDQQVAKNCDYLGGRESYIQVFQPAGSYLIKLENEHIFGAVGVGTSYTFEIINQ